MFECVGHPVCSVEHHLPELDTIAVGKVLAWPLPRILIMSVDRYYKSEGPRILVAEVPGALGRWYDYHHGSQFRRSHYPDTPYVFGFRKGWGVQLVSTYCAPAWLFSPGSPEYIAVSGLGDGVEPEPGIGLRSNFAIWFPPAIILGLIFGLRALIRRRRDRKP